MHLLLFNRRSRTPWKVKACLGCLWECDWRAGVNLSVGPFPEVPSTAAQQQAASHMPCGWSRLVNHLFSIFAGFRARCGERLVAGWGPPQRYSGERVFPGLRGLYQTPVSTARSRAVAWRDRLCAQPQKGGPSYLCAPLPSHSDTSLLGLEKALPFSPTHIAGAGTWPSGQLVKIQRFLREIVSKCQTRAQLGVFVRGSPLLPPSLCLVLFFSPGHS